MKFTIGPINLPEQPYILTLVAEGESVSLRLQRGSSVSIRVVEFLNEGSVNIYADRLRKFDLRLELVNLLGD